MTFLCFFAFQELKYIDVDYIFISFQYSMATQELYGPLPPSPAISNPIETLAVKTVKTVTTPPIESTTSTRQLRT